MTSGARRVLQLASARWVGERVIPVGGVARDRRLLRRALKGERPQKVLVIGPSIAVRQVLQGQHVDVTGTSPYAAYITVCSNVRGVGSLPPLRWDTVIITDPGENLTERLKAVQSACRPSAQLMVMDRGERAVRGTPVTVISAVAEIEETLARGTHFVWVARMRS